MVFGSCCILYENYTQNIQMESVEINGFQRGLLINFEVTQTFIHTEKEPKEVSYILPNDNKICIYDTTFVVGNEIIKPKLQSKEEAQKTYDEAIETGHTAFYGSNIGSGLTQFKLGNIKPKTKCKVILKLAFTGQITKEKSFFVKFPIDVYTPYGSVCCLDTDSSNFSFILQSEKEKISKITSNVKNCIFDATTKIFSINDKIKNDDNEKSIIINFETNKQITNSAFLINQENFDFLALTISPNLPKTAEIFNSEFVFVIDCSGSMRGNSIKKASECLELFIKSLPQNSYFNVVRFGFGFKKLFENSVVYNDETAEKAINLAQKLRADLGGTDILSPLENICKETNKHGQRQIFIMTDGEVDNVDDVLEFVSVNSKNNRCFTIGIGRGCDAGLVEGMAQATGGKSDFVQEGNSISEKVIPQLQSSFYPSLSSIEVHIENDNSFEISPFPIPPISANGSIVVYICEKNRKNSYQNGILITGLYGEKQVEFQIEQIESLVNVDENEYGCSKGQNIGKCIIPLFAFKQLQKLERISKISAEEKSKAIELSILGGVLCKYTGYVGMTEIHENDQQLGFYDGCSLMDTNSSSTKKTQSMLIDITFPSMDYNDSDHSPKKETPKQSWFGKIWNKFFGKSDNSKTADPTPNNNNEMQLKEEMSNQSDQIIEDDHPPKLENNVNLPTEYDLITLARYQKVGGFWEDLKFVQSLTGIKIDHIDEINISDKNIENKCIATIIALAAMRTKSSNEKNSWILIEEKALSWLKKILGDTFDIENIISKIKV